MITNLGAGNPFDSMYKIQGVIQKAGTKEKIEFSFTHIGDSFRSGLLEKGQLSVRNLTGNGLKHGQAQSLFAWVQRVHVWVPNLLLGLHELCTGSKLLVWVQILHVWDPNVLLGFNVFCIVSNTSCLGSEPSCLRSEPLLGFSDV